MQSVHIVPIPKSAEDRGVAQAPVPTTAVTTPVRCCSSVLLALNFMLSARSSLCQSLKSLQKPLVFTVLIIVRCSAPFYRLPHPLELLKINLLSSEADTIALVLLVISTEDTCF